MFGFFIGTACLVGFAALARRGRRHHFYGHGGCHHGHRGRGGRFFIHRILGRLDTTPGQEKVIREAIADLKDEAWSLRSEIRGTRSELAQAIRAPELDKALIDRCLDCFHQFFALPVEEKLRYKLPSGGGARGYTPFGIETAKGAKHYDLKEFWHVGRELPPGHPFHALMAPNIWVDSIPGFRETTYGLYQAFDALGAKLLSAIGPSRRRFGASVAACYPSMRTRQVARAANGSGL